MQVKKALDENKLNLDASISCPLILEEIEQKRRAGYTSFLFTGFPLTAKQRTFLELRLKATSRAVVLDYSQRDATELGLLAGLSQSQVENEIAVVYGAELGDTPTTKISLSIPRVGKDQLMQTLERTTWSAVSQEIQPGLTLVLGPPGCYQREFSQAWADRTAGSFAVDVDDMLDKELERQTPVGREMAAMLGRGS